MKSKLFRLFGKSALPTLLAGALLAFSSPVAALAQNRGGGGHSAGRSYSGGSARGFSGGGERSYAGGGRDNDRGHGGGYYRGGGGHYGGGVYLGFGAPYAYGSAYGYGYAPAPAPCGFYDQAGYWQATPCYGPPAGY